VNNAQSYIDLAVVFCYGNYKESIQKKGARSMLRRIASAFLVVFCIAGIALAEGMKHFDPKDLKARNLLLEAFQSVSPYQREVKLKEVLKINPDNYFALIRLGELEMDRGEDHQLKAIDYFLSAALAQPQRPEAYLSLAQMYFQMGYIPEGMDYMMKALAGPRTRLTYEAVCLEGQQLLDTANYFAAVITYADAALSKSSPWHGDPYLLNKLYEATTLSDAPTFWVWKDSGLAAEGVGNVYWIQYVFAKLVAGTTTFSEDAAFRSVIQWLRSQAEKLREIRPELSARAAEKLINVHLYRTVMLTIRNMAGDTPENDHYRLPKRFFNFGVCSQEDTRMLDENLNLYEVFIEASVTDPKERQALLEKLDGVKKEAIAAVSNIKDPKKRGEALFKWLREKLIKKYDAIDGIPAENVINNNKYLCLSGAILYTLIGRDAGLDVNGFIVPNHAYSVMKDKDGNRINVETTAPVKETAELPAGFDLANDSVVARGTDLKTQAQFEGEVSPMELVSYQFINVGVNKFHDLMINKYRNELDTVLKEAGYDSSEIEGQVTRWRQARDLPKLMTAMMQMSLKYPKFHEEMTSAIDDALSTFSKARSFDPFNTEFLRRIEKMAEIYRGLAMASPKSSMQKRLRKIKEESRHSMRDGVGQDMRHDAESQAEAEKKDKTKDKAKKTTETKKTVTAEDRDKASRKKEVKEKPERETTSTVELETEAPQIKSFESEKDRNVAVARSEYEATPEEISREWPRERRFWLASLKRLEKLAKEHPCSDWLKRTLFAYAMEVADVMMEAKKVNLELEEGSRLDYEDIIDELNRVRIEFFDTQPALASRLSAKLGEVL
jgi:tetratricopeptide (TPR) repeat protein